MACRLHEWCERVKGVVLPPAVLIMAMETQPPCGGAGVSPASLSRASRAYRRDADAPKRRVVPASERLNASSTGPAPRSTVAEFVRCSGLMGARGTDRRSKVPAPRDLRHLAGTRPPQGGSGISPLPSTPTGFGSSKGRNPTGDRHIGVPVGESGARPNGISLSRATSKSALEHASTPSAGHAGHPNAGHPSLRACSSRPAPPVGRHRKI